jgi:hypothetical protein
MRPLSRRRRGGRLHREERPGRALRRAASTAVLAGAGNGLLVFTADSFSAEKGGEMGLRAV